MSLLTMIQTAAEEIGAFDAPTSVIGSTDQSVIQLEALANRAGKRLATRYNWQILVKEGTFLTVATESQGTMASLGSGAADYSDFDHILNDTVWNRTQSERVGGPLSANDWQQEKATISVGVYNYWRLRGDSFLMYPTPTAGETVAFEYVSKNWCESSGGTDQSAWAADTDTGILDEDLMTKDIIWRFYMAKGLPYDEQFRDYEVTLKDALLRDGGKPIISLGGRKRSSLPHVQDGDYTI